MTTKKFENPFSEGFMPTWNLWKEFRKEEHNFQYKGLISEQMAINRLVEVAEGDEEKAERIVKQSISRGWMDFYQLKQSTPTKNGNGHGKQKQPAAKETGTSDMRERIQRAVNKKFGNGENFGSEPNLTAV